MEMVIVTQELLLHFFEALAALGYLGATCFYCVFFAKQKPRHARIGSRFITIAVAVHLTWWIMKTCMLGFFPFTQWQDCVSFIALALAVNYLYIELSQRERRMGVFVVPVIFLLQILALHQLWVDPLDPEMQALRLSGLAGHCP